MLKPGRRVAFSASEGLQASGAAIGRESGALAALARMVRQCSLPVSQSALDAFAANVGSDPQLRQKLQAVAGLDDVLAIAESHGHSFSKSTLLKAHAAAVAAAPDHALEGLNSWGDALMHCFGVSNQD
jgi:predicted ribosomally synthesized peptide with nif11-like leader